MTIVPLEVIIRNISAGSFSKRYGVAEGIVFDEPTIEFSYKNDDLGDPLINSYHALALKLATKEEIETIKALRLSGQRRAEGLFPGPRHRPGGLQAGVRHVCPTAPLFWPTRSPPTPAVSGMCKTHEKLDKDRFRRDLGGVEEAYQEVMRRLMGE